MRQSLISNLQYFFLPRPQSLLLTILLLGYWAVSLSHLTILPPIYEDESWQASTGWQWATEGRFASDLFAGWNGMEERYYGYMPLHASLLAGTYRLAGVGLFQSRFVSVALGLLVLALTFALGKRLWSARHGLLAAFFLLLAVTTTQTPSQFSGILLIDIARIARYDMLVPVFGLGALHAAWRAQRGRSALWWGASGILAGLAGLSHLYGLFFVMVVGLLALWMRAGGRALVALALGAALPWLPYIAYVLTDVPMWRAQTSLYGPRFELLNPRWYLTNLLLEPLRYWVGTARTPFLVWLLVGLSLLALGRRALRGDERARLLVLPALLVPLLFALLITIKLINYRVVIEPLWALAAAWGAITFWSWLGEQSWARARRLVLVIALALIAVDGLTRIATMQAAASTMTPYPALIARIRAEVPPGATVLGMHNYWLGMEDTTYRAWIVPIAEASGAADQAEAIQQSLDRLDPHTVTIDREIREYLDHPPPGDPLPGAVWQWLASRGYAPRTVVDDPTYGRLELWRR